MILDVGTMILIETPQYGRVLHEVTETEQRCPYCNEDDYHTLSVVADRNVGLIDNTYIMPNVRAGMSVKVCGKVIEKERKKNPNSYRIIEDQKEIDYRNNLLAIDSEY